jgi:MarR family 2-MHQ and catechol resistance regulon transcriptional repressor
VTANNIDNIPVYVAEAISSLEEIMLNNQKNMFEHMTKTTRGESFVLKFLSNSDCEVLPSDLSTALHSSPARISAILRTLEKKGEIARETDKANRRNTLVTITETGKKRARDDMQKVHDRMVETFTEMGEADTREFIRLTRKVLGEMHKID